MLPDKSVKCHRTGFTKSCHDGVVKCKCSLWIRVDGLDAMGREIDVHGCADVLSIKFLHEIAKEIRQAAASTDKVANEVRHSRNQNASSVESVIRGVMEAVRGDHALPSPNGHDLLIEDNSDG